MTIHQRALELANKTGAELAEEAKKQSQEDRYQPHSYALGAMIIFHDILAEAYLDLLKRTAKPT